MIEYIEKFRQNEKFKFCRVFMIYTLKKFNPLAIMKSTATRNTSKVQKSETDNKV